MRTLSMFVRYDDLHWICVVPANKMLDSMNLSSHIRVMMFASIAFYQEISVR